MTFCKFPKLQKNIGCDKLLILDNMNTKKFKYLIILILFSSVSLLNSCDKGYDEVKDEAIDNELEIFKKNFPCEFENIGIEYVQREITNKSGGDNLSKSGISFPIIDDGKVIGRYLGLSDQSAATYIDFTDYENQVTVYDVLDPSKFQIFKMIYNPEKGLYEPIILKSTTGFWCGAACALGTIAIAASDGPSPLMDILAVSFSVACLADCLAAE